MKQILISIKPKWVAKILNGEKTIEIRKTCPSIFKDWECDKENICPVEVYIYCTKEEYLTCDLYTGKARYHNILKGKNGFTLSGKIVAKFTLNKVEEIRFDDKEVQIKACLAEDELFDYLFVNEPYHEDMKKGYAWHISNLVIFDKPKELSEFKNVSCEECPVNYMCTGTCPYKLTKAPQSWCYIEVEN